MPEIHKKILKGLGFKPPFSRDRHSASGATNSVLTNAGPANIMPAPRVSELVAPISSPPLVAQAPPNDQSTPDRQSTPNGRPATPPAQTPAVLADTPTTSAAQTPSPLKPLESAESTATNTEAHTETDTETDANDIDPWTAAFRLFQKKSPGLADSYEKCLASLLGMTADNVKLAVPRSVETIVQTQLERHESKQWKLPLPSGKTANVRKQTEKLFKLLLYFDPIVKDALSAQPYAALAWSGVSMLLSLLTNATTQNEKMLEGFNSINDILAYWNAGEEILRNDNAGAQHTKRGFLGSLANLYCSIIEYQASVICHISKGQGSRKLHIVVGAVEWATKAQNIAKLNIACKDLVEISYQVAIQRANDSKLQGIHAIIVALEQSERQTRDRERDEKERALLHDLECPYDSYKDFNRKRVQGTCEWFFNDDRFHAWRDASTSSLLWVSAGPGCGKSVLSRAIVDDLRASTAGGSSTVCHFFFKDGLEGRMLGANALSAILHNLFAMDASESLIQHALPSHRNRGKGLAQNFLELWKILTDCAQSDDAREIICVLDALDECEQRSRDELILCLKQFYSGQQHTSAKASKLKFIITSRPYDDLERQFARFATVNYIQFHGDDKSAEISREIDFVIDELVEEVAGTFSYEDQENLKTHLKRMENRTYLWLHLTFDIIRQSPSEFGRPCEIDELLSILPSQVADAYDKILNRSKNKERTEAILHIVLAARKPLTLHEANNALAMALALQKKNSRPPSTSAEFEKQLWPDDIFKSVVTNLCGLFISVHDEELVFIHQTARDFLVGPRNERNAWQGRFVLPKSHSVMSSICVHYLLLRGLPVFTDDYDYDRLERHLRFLQYAAEHWHQHFHAQEPSSRVELVSEARILCDTTDDRNKVWISASAEPDVLNRMTSLVLASYFYLAPVVKDMLKTDKVNVNECDIYGKTALHHAVRDGQPEFVRLLLENGADVHVQCEWGKTPLHDAARYGRTKIVRILLDNGADVHVRCKDGETPLHDAAIYGRTKIIRLLLDNGADVHVLCKDGVTSLHLAAEGGYTKIVRLLLDNGADVHVQSKSGKTALHHAAEEGHMEIVQLLLDNGADVKVLCKSSEKALHHAAKEGYTEIVRLLLDNGADVHVRCKDGETPLHGAASNGHTEIVQLLLNNGAGVHVQSEYGNTPLHDAATYGCTKTVRLLLDNGADIHVQNKAGETPLHGAARNDRTKIVRLLLANGADIHVQCDSGKTALHYAAEEGHTELLVNGVDVHVQYKDDERPLLVASHGGTKLVQLLLDNGADVHVQCKDGETPLHLAAKKGHTEIVRLLLDNGADIHVQTANGDTAFHMATDHGRTETFRLLLNSGANIDTQNKDS